MEFTRCFQCMKETRDYPCPHCGYDPGAERPKEYGLRPGTILNGKYVVGAILGQGGFGITYTGWDLGQNRKVAIKEYYPSGQVARSTNGTLHWYSTPQAETPRNLGKEMFLKEARKMTRVRNIPQVVHVHDLFQENGTAYIVMDFVEGKTLKAHLTKPLTWEEAKKIFFPAIQAMEQVHQAGLVHRDLSPDNLMLLPDGSVRILDLGAAKDLNINSGASSMQVAKSGFSPWEQYTQRGGSGPWSDVYAMAATMYYSLTGVVPPPVMDRMEDDQLRWDLESLKALPEPALEALKKAMALLAKDRTQSMGEFLRQLESAIPRPKPTPKPKPTPSPDSGPDSDSDQVLMPSKKTLLAAIAAVLVVALIAGWVARPRQKTEPQLRSHPQTEATFTLSTEPEATFPLPTEPEVSSTLPIQEQTIFASTTNTFAIKRDGSVVSAGRNTHGQGDVSAWTDIVAVSGNLYHTVGLKADGSVVATVVTSADDDYGQCDVSDWTDIVAICAGQRHTVGLKADGTVVATGENDCIQCNVSDWTDIVAICAGGYHTVGLKTDGTVIARGKDNYDQCDVFDWKDIVAISANREQTIGLKADGTVVAAGENTYGQCDVSDWKDIVAISAGHRHTVGLKADGTVVSTQMGNHIFNYCQCDVSGWTDIIAISAGTWHTVGLKADGTIVSTSVHSGTYNFGQDKVSDWTDIRIPGYCTSVSDEQLVSEYTDAEVTFQLANGKYVSGTVSALPAPMANCNAITTSIEITELNSGNVEGEWGLWVRQLNGEWILAGTFDLEGDSAYARLEFDDPISFDAWVCLCHCLGDYWSFSCRIWLQDATQFHYTWER